MDVSASAVKELREKTGAGMMDCKKALADAGQFIHQAGGVPNAEKAITVLESLREKIG